MRIVICPGIHPPTLTDSFLNSLAQQQVSLDDVLVFPYSNCLVLSPYHLLHFLEEQQVKLSESLLLIGFSAGVVGAMGAAGTLAVPHPPEGISIWPALGKP